MSEVIKVGMADLNVCKAPDVITTLGLGSCIGLVFYDPVSKVGGMVHYMLPDSTKVRNNSNIAKFADTGIDELLRRVIAAGANKIVLDVTCGSGAFMKTVGEARELSKTMIDIGKLANKETVCIITNMDQPLGTMVGNTLEVIEAIEALKGNMQDDVKNVVLELGAYILKLDGKGDNIQENKEKIEQVISNGEAYRKFLQLVENQGGDISYIENTEKFTKAKYKMPVEAIKTGYVQKLNAEDVGKIAMHLGAGRMKKEDDIDYAVGIELLKKVGCQVEQGETIAYIYADDEQKGREVVEKLQQTYEIGEQNVEKFADIIEIIE